MTLIKIKNKITIFSKVFLTLNSHTMYSSKKYLVTDTTYSALGSVRSVVPEIFLNEPY